MESYLGAEARILDYPNGDLFDRRAILAAAGRQAAILGASGVSKDHRVVLGHGQGAAFIADLLAIWSLGATALIVSPGLTRDERANVVSNAEPCAWIGTGVEDGNLPHVAPSEMRADAVGEPRDWFAQPDDTAVIMMTSGTTSRPKGVMLSHRAIQARLSLNLAYMGASDLSVSLNVLPMHFGHGLIGNCLTPLYAGAKLIAWPEPGGAGMTTLGRAIDTHGVTFLSSVPTLWRAVLRLSTPPQGGSLRRVHVGSAPLSAQLWGRIVEWCDTRRVVNMYGITECANWICGESAEDTLNDEDLVDGTVGRPWGGRIGIIADDGTVRSDGRGEVVVSNPCLMTGYYGIPSNLAGGWLRTGDIGRLTTDGRLCLVGRVKHEINRGGIKVPAEEIDLLFERHADVAEACAFALDDPLEGELVAVAVVGRTGAKICGEDLIAWCEPRIRRQAVPARIFFIDSLPKNARGKVNRDNVRAMCLQQPSDSLEAESGHGPSG